ncbi:MAG: QueT transporter family protein [Tepidanaerobacteraceae bacterium]|nr:QueT transporter family protein [Tepidanaerobacteraceae bacterium]
MNKVRYLARAAVIAAVYASVTYILKPISYGPIQVRISESLTILPMLESSAVPGLFVGCFLANMLGGLGPWDIYGGSLITLVAAYITSKTRSPFFGALPPVLLNAFGVSYYLSFLYDMPYWMTVLYIGAGEFIAVAGLGIPLYYFVKRKGLERFFKK